MCQGRHLDAEEGALPGTQAVGTGAQVESALCAKAEKCSTRSCPRPGFWTHEAT